MEETTSQNAVISHDRLRTLRSMALEVGRVHEEHLDAWDRLRLEANSLARQIYSSAGAEPSTPIEAVVWRSRDLVERLISMCDDAISRARDEAGKQAVLAVRDLLSVIGRARLGRRRSK